MGPAEEGESDAPDHDFEDYEARAVGEVGTALVEEVAAANLCARRADGALCQLHP
jgi:hypothetical protein